MDNLLRCFDPTDARRSVFDRKSAPPASVGELASASELVLAHATSSVFLPRILAVGLTPDTYGDRTVSDGLPSDIESVYLSIGFDSFYLDRATTHHGGEGVVVEVKVQVANLRPDENWGPPTGMPLLEQVQRSLVDGKCCKHHGVISPERILAVYNRAGDALTRGQQAFR